jgi:hypothetical protein
MELTAGMKAEMEAHWRKHIQQLKAHVGQRVRQGLVIYLSKPPRNAPEAFEEGTLLKVNRKLALVDFGEPTGRWRVPMAHLEII